MLSEASVDVVILAMDIRRDSPAHSDKPGARSNGNKPALWNTHPQYRIDADACSNGEKSSQRIKICVNAHRVIFGSHLENYSTCILSCRTI
jgi:hypothetical protein